MVHCQQNFSEVVQSSGKCQTRSGITARNDIKAKIWQESLELKMWGYRERQLKFRFLLQDKLV